MKMSIVSLEKILERTVKNYVLTTLYQPIE